MDAPRVEALLEHTSFMRALAGSLLGGDESRVDDVVQEAWLAALRRPPRDPDRLRAWLGRVVRNFALRDRRDRARRGRREAVAAPADAVPSGEEILARENVRRSVVHAVLALEEPYRSTIVLRYLEERKPREVARLLGVPVETVRTRTKRALKQLRERLDEEHGDRRTWSLALLPFAVPKASALGAGTTGVLLMLTTKTKLAAAGVAVAAALLLLFTLRSHGGDGGGTPRAERPADAPARAVPQADAGGRGVPGAGEAEDADVSGGRDAPAEPAAPEGATIVGRVVADERPLDGAYVYLRSAEGLVDDVASTDATGAFAFTARGRFTLGAAHPARRPVRRGVATGEEPVRVELSLPPAIAVGVLVVDAATREPVAGAEVLLLRSGDDDAGGFNEVVFARMLEPEDGLKGLLHRASAFDQLTEAFAVFDGAGMPVNVPPVVTDGRGRAKLGGLVPGPFEAVVTHPDYPPRRAVRPRVDDGDTVEVALERGGSVRVIAPRLDGGPAAGWLCELDRAGLVPLPAGEVRFDERGQAVLAAVRPGTYVATISKDGAWQIDFETEETVGEDGNPLRRRKISLGRRAGAALLSRPVQVRAGRETVLDLSEWDGVSVRGRVVVGEGDAGVWSVTLLRGEGFENEHATVLTDETGAFALEKVPPGPCRFVAHPAGGGGEIRHDQELGFEGTAEVVLRAEAGAVFGLVTGPDGRPLAGANVWLLPGGRDRALPQDVRQVEDLVGAIALRQTETGEDGGYRVEPVPAGAYDAYVGGQGHLAHAAVRLDPGGDARLDVALDASLPRLVVRLAGPDGAPREGWVLVRGERTGLLVAMAVCGAEFDPDAPPRAEHDFRLAPDRYLVDAFVEGLAPLRGYAVDLAADREVELRLVPGVEATLVLTGPDGPRAGAEIELVDAGTGLRLTPHVHPFEFLFEPGTWRADAEGRVVVPHCPPGEYEVHHAGEPAGRVRVGTTPVGKTIRIE